ncbi:MAG TPA: hypothetical protein VHI93_03375 [Candidatus Thermoplasmatota archaeon]|nr:hypothetical protein [Candidatus Thermoplasmatota archaeon]
MAKSLAFLAACLMTAVGAPAATATCERFGWEFAEAEVCAVPGGGGLATYEASIQPCVEVVCVGAGGEGRAAAHAVETQAGAFVCLAAEQPGTCVAADEDLEEANACQHALGLLATQGPVEAGNSLGDSCVSAVPSGTAGAAYATLEDCSTNPLDCPSRVRIPEGAVIVIEYLGCDYCFRTTLTSGWACITEVFSSTEVVFRCAPMTSIATCANFAVYGEILNGDRGAELYSVTECDSYQAKCHAYATIPLKGNFTGLCEGKGRTPSDVPPPLYCQMAAIGPGIRHAVTACYNDP